MSGTPPSEPEDAERTVGRPAPGGRKPASTGAAPAAHPGDPDAVEANPEGAAIIDNPLLQAATPLLQLLGRLSNTVRHPNARTLRERVGRELGAFERRCRIAGISMELLRPAHYALCAAIDDVVLHTPWGAASTWKTNPLAGSLYKDAHNEEQFFEILTQLRQQPDKFLPVIELMYLCLSLGFFGRYRDSLQDPGRFDQLRNELRGLIILHRGSADQQLSPRWQGVSAAYRGRFGTFPIWVPMVAAAAMSR